MKLDHLSLLLGGLLLTIVGCTSHRQTAATQPAPSQTLAQRTEWWRDAKFGMFIHWGIYSVPADCTKKDGKRSIAEWYLSNKEMQVKDYEKFASQFNPVDFDARQWVRIAKNAGMRYIVITSKHHDGFCMFDSKLTDYTITKATPFKRDPLKELADACEKEGITLCFYHSIMDWHHPDYLPRRKWETGVRDAGAANLNHYIDYMKGQLTELLTHYGRIGIIWFDGGWEHNEQELRSAEVNAMIRKLQPDIIINDRNKLKEDYDTPEQFIPAEALAEGRLWETCMTMNDTWGYARNDQNWKSSEVIIRDLIDIAHKGGNFLLNVGPTDRGVIPQASVERLANVGRWMDANGESIYGTTKSPWKTMDFDGRCTVKDNCLYLHVFNWPSYGIHLKGLRTPIKSAYLLDGHKDVLVITDPNHDITLGPPARLDPVATVVKVVLDGPIEVDAPTIRK